MKLLSAKFFNGSKCLLAGITALLSLGTSHSVMAINLYQLPLFLSQPVRPIVMLNVSNDHQLFFKAYDDFSDLTGDGFANTTYTLGEEYYGYFDSQYCYSYSSGRFNKTDPASGDYFCEEGSGHWSGNFLNWATMTRIDVTRKILYGGKRSTDNEGLTVLERSFLPADAHAFVKYYNGTRMNELTPYNHPGEGINDGISICNVSTGNTGAPVMRVARGNYSLWSNNERFQCYWSENVPNLGWTDQAGKNGNNFIYSGFMAHGNSPSTGVRLAELNVRVRVCESDKIGPDNMEGCRRYGNGDYKPTGVLHAYGQDDSIYFGLITGSYMKNKSGGVLRSNVGSFTEEVNLATGQFKSKDGEPGIVGTLDALRIVDYNFTDGTYGNCGNPSVNFGKTDNFTNGRCVNWGNPQSEIYLESLRYLAGASGPIFSANDTSKVASLSTVTWEDPINDENSCAPLSVLQFNASTSSYDGDDLVGNLNAIGLSDLDAITNVVGVGEGIHGNSFFVGESNSAGNEHIHQLCTAKSITSLAGVLGTCPDAPRLGGSYQIAGLAYHARRDGVREGRRTVRTFGVTLAPAIPQINVQDQGVTILPACRAKRNGEVYTNCGLVDFKVVEEAADHSYGKYLVSWEDTEQGGDYDQDLMGTIEYQLDGAGNIEITTSVFLQSTDDPMGFGYVISGTNMDGFHAHSGLHNFVYDDPYADVLACGRGDTICFCGGGGNYGGCPPANIVPTTQSYAITSASAQLLEQPLYYAAKWGGYDDKKGLITAPETDENPTYFAVTKPRELEAALKRVFDEIQHGDGAATAVASNSTRLGTDTFVYQATFNTDNWSGDLQAISITEDGEIGDPVWQASAKLPTPNNRNIYSVDESGERINFVWGELSGSQIDALNDDELGPQRVRWLRGETVAGLRPRTSWQLLGDIVNSSPVFFGKKDYGFARMSSHGGPSYNAYVTTKADKTEMVYVQANDGKLHAFNANDGMEEFAYVPLGVYPKLSAITAENYGSSVNPHVFTADGQITVGDIFVGGQWRTILVGTLGAGGTGVYVLDVTNPTNPRPVVDTTGDTNPAHIGNIFGKPAVVPLPKGSWGIAFGNGYNSVDGEAKLIVLELNNNATGVQTTHVMSTNVVGDNGLAEPSFTVVADGTVGVGYAGDRLGNLWRFDMSGNLNSTPTRLFSAGADQPITAAPVLGINRLKRDSSGRVRDMVYFGTGHYMTLNDLSNTDVQSFYAIADTGVSLTQSDLVENTITTTGTSRTVYEHQVDENSGFDWSDDDTHGWYVNFPASGERVVSKPMLLFDRLIFPTIVPSEEACKYGGSSWIMELVAVGDLYKGQRLLEQHGMESETLVSLSDLIMGQDATDGVIVVQQSDGTLTTLDVTIPEGATGRQSWRQLR